MTAKTHLEVRILAGKAAIHLLDNVCKAADENTKALGFFAASVYSEFARSDQLHVAVTTVQGKECYVGHLLFDPRFPRAQVLQVFCRQEFRKRGVASDLLNGLIAQLTNQGFLSIQARVADELSSANALYESLGFYVQRTVLGRGPRGREINVRIRELDAPQLFERSALATDSGNVLGLSYTSAPELPIYLVDMNVLFDLACRRIRHDQVADLFRVVHSGHARLGVSDEARRELLRTPRSAPADPMFELIGLLPQFLCPDGDQGGPDLARLTTAVFPNQSRQGSLSANDVSDVRHLATAIYHRLSGFITSDDAILTAAPEIEAQFGLRIFSPDAFKGRDAEVSGSRSVTLGADRRLELRHVRPSDETAVRQLLTTYGVGSVRIVGSWLAANPSSFALNGICVWIDDDLAGYMVLSPDLPGSKQALARAVVDERLAEAPNVARLLLRALLDTIAVGPREIRLEVLAQQSELRDRAHQHGFSSGGLGVLVKIAASTVLTASTWRAGRDAILSACNLKLPNAPMSYRSPAQLIEVLSPDGCRRFVPLDTLESSLSPLLFCLPGRPAVITPIRRRFADLLLGHSRQTSFLPDPSASLFEERHFLCGPNSIKHLKPGSLMLFYESSKGKGQKGIVAIGRVTQAYLTRRDEVNVSVLEKSVLSRASLEALGTSPTKAVAAFDNIFPLQTPIGLSFLRSIGCGNANHLITTRPIADDQLQAILKEAFQ